MAGPMNMPTNDWRNTGAQQPGMGMNYGMPSAPQPYPSTNFQSVQQPQPIQSPQSPFVGRFIDSLDEIVPNEVPMDGRPGYFPTRNLEEIYFKAWKSDGQVKTLRYVLDPTFNPTPPPQNEISMMTLLARIDDLEKKLADSGKNNRTASKGGEK